MAKNEKLTKPKKAPKAPKAPRKERFSQIREAYQITKKSDPAIGL